MASHKRGNNANRNQTQGGIGNTQHMNNNQGNVNHSNTNNGISGHSNSFHPNHTQDIHQNNNYNNSNNQHQSNSSNNNTNNNSIPTQQNVKQTMREVGVILDCLFCNSLFVVSVKMIDLKAFRERQSKELLLRHCQKIQKRSKEASYPFICCPLCTELITGYRYHEFLGDGRKACVLSICRYMMFSEEDDNTPIYINMEENDVDKRAKWTLMQGTGPKTLDLDKNGFTISKNSLLSCGVVITEYEVEKTRQEHEYIITMVFKAIKALRQRDKVQEAEHVIFELFKLQPLYKNWHKVQEQIESLVSDHSIIK